MKNKNKSLEKLFITGGAGFIGANLIRKFLSLGYEIHCTVKPNTNLWRLVSCKNEISFYEVGLDDRKGLKDLIEEINPTLIIHLAAYGNNSSQTDFDKIIDTNILGTMNLLAASKNVAYKAFINTGSSSEYGFKIKPMKESDLLEPNSIYSATKASSTYICSVFAKDYDKPIVTVRPFSVYGPYESSGRLIPEIMKAVVKGTSINLSSKESMHDFIYVDDLVEGYLLIVKNISKILGQSINLGTGKEYSNADIVKKLFEVSNKTVPVIIGNLPPRKWDSSHWVANIDLSKEFLKWQPKTDLSLGLKKTYKWFMENINLYE